MAGTFILQLAILAVVVLHLAAAWKYKARYFDLNLRVERLEAALYLSSAPSETAMTAQLQAILQSLPRMSGSMSNADSLVVEQNPLKHP